MEFLAKHKEMVKYQMSDIRQAAGATKTQTQVCFVTGPSSQVKVSPQNPGHQKQSTKIEMKPCLACDDGATNVDVIKHSAENCEVWDSLKVKEKESKVKCRKHPGSH